MGANNNSKMMIILSAIIFLFPLSLQATDISYCSFKKLGFSLEEELKKYYITKFVVIDTVAKKLYLVKVSDVVISPYPVKTGGPTTFTIKASTDEPFKGGKLVLAVSYFGVKVHGETDNICDKTSCPISAGEFELSHTQTLPIVTPPGTYTLKMRIKDQKDTELTCISFKFKIGFGEYDEVM